MYEKNTSKYLVLGPSTRKKVLVIESYTADTLQCLVRDKLRGFNFLIDIILRFKNNIFFVCLKIIEILNGNCKICFNLLFFFDNFSIYYVSPYVCIKYSKETQ